MRAPEMSRNRLYMDYMSKYRSKNYEIDEEFRFEGEAQLADLHALLPRDSDVDWVEHNRLSMIKSHLDILLTPGIDEKTEKLNIAYLGHLGALGVLDYLPEK